jgi:hypothetical protein
MQAKKKRSGKFTWDGISYTKQHITPHGVIEFSIVAEETASDKELRVLEELGLGILDRWYIAFASQVVTRCKKYLRKGIRTAITNNMLYLTSLTVDVRDERDHDRFLLNVFIKNCDENLLESDYLEVQVLRKNDRVLIEPVFRE